MTGPMIDWSNPLVIAAIVAVAVAVLLLVLLIWAIRAARRSADAAEPLAQHLGTLSDAVRGLD